MEIAPVRTRFILLAILGLVGSHSQAVADPLYTLTDLGPVANVSLSTDANGNGIVTNGQASYAFQPTSLGAPADLDPNLTNLMAAPWWRQDTNGNPNFAFSYSNLMAIIGLMILSSPTL